MKKSIANQFRSVGSPKNLRKIAAKIIHRTVAGIDGVKGSSFKPETLAKETERWLAKEKREFSCYRERLILRGQNRRPRVISIPTVRDAVIFRLLAEALRRDLPSDAAMLPHDIVKCVKKKLEMGAGVFDTFIRTDIRDFFPSINHSILLDILRNRIQDKEIIPLIESALKPRTIPVGKKGRKGRRKKGVPQGLAISGILANFYMADFDKQHHSNANAYAYFRYVDDILILCRAGEEGKIWESVRQGLIDDLRLSIHSRRSRKTQIDAIAKSGFISYLGYTFSRTTTGKVVVGVRKISVGKICRSIIGIFTAYKNLKAQHNAKVLLEWRLNLRITGCRFSNKRYGWIHYYSQVNDFALLRQMDRFVDKMKKRFHVSDMQTERFVFLACEVKKKTSPQIPDFDEWNIFQKRTCLKDVFSVANVDSKSDGEVDELFQKKIFRDIKQLERDIHPKGESG